MSSTETSPSTQPHLTCPCCEAVTTEAEKYCASCGLTLWENCPSCKKPTRIGQKFCGGCGFNLLADFEARLNSATAVLERAGDALERSDFDEAIAMATRVIHRDDPRFLQLSKEATELVGRARQAQQQWQARLEGLAEAVESAANAEDYERVIDLLAPFPSAVLGESLARSLALARSQAAAVGELSLRLRRAIENKDVITAGRLVEELLAHLPGHPQYTALAFKIGAALFQSAERRFQRGLYADASARLEAIPEVARTAEEYEPLRAKADEAVWLQEQFSQAPFATPTLFRFAERLRAIDPQNPHSEKLLQRVVARARTAPENSYSLFAAWNHEPRGWQGAPITLLKPPQNIAADAVAVVQRHPTRFTVAIGLAVQGLGRSAFKGSLSSASKKLGLKDLLGRPTRPSAAWGIDVGASAVRAVRLEQAGEEVRIAAAYLVPYDQPHAAAKNITPPAPALESALKEIASRVHASGGESVWSNLGSSETLGRFVKLPPAADKTLAKIIEQETLSGFPVAADQLCIAHALTRNSADHSPRAIFVAARRESVERREDLFASVGLKLAGLQANPVALHNFVRHQLSEVIANPRSEGSAPAGVIAVDAGATGVVFLLATAETFWFRAIDGAGDDLTSRLVTACKMTRSQAETLKSHPEKIPSLPLAMRALEGDLRRSGARLQQCYQNAIEFVGEVRLEQILCTGGTSLMHGWVRHVLQESEE